MSKRRVLILTTLPLPKYTIECYWTYNIKYHNDSIIEVIK